MGAVMSNAKAGDFDVTVVLSSSGEVEGDARDRRDPFRVIWKI